MLQEVEIAKQKACVNFGAPRFLFVFCLAQKQSMKTRKIVIPERFLFVSEEGKFSIILLGPLDQFPKKHGGVLCSDDGVSFRETLILATGNHRYEGTILVHDAATDKSILIQKIPRFEAHWRATNSVDAIIVEGRPLLRKKHLGQVEFVKVPADAFRDCSGATNPGLHDAMFALSWLLNFSPDYQHLKPRRSSKQIDE